MTSVCARAFAGYATIASNTATNVRRKRRTGAAGMALRVQWEELSLESYSIETP
jgi:hypothetical protein